MPLSADDLALVEDVAGFRFDPLGHVLYSYPWGVPGTSLEHSSGPYPWVREFLTEIGDRLKAGEPLGFPEVIREAVASGHGIAKTTTVIFLLRWALDTFEDARVVVTANTEKQLLTKTWPELAKWHQMAITKHWWTMTATAYYSNDEAHERTWRADAIAWSEHNTEAFAGLHNKGRRIVVLFDEASKIADKVWEVAEGALTDSGTEIIWGVFGNPTQASGRFRECFRKFAHRWTPRQIDARNVPGTNRVLHDQWVADYGEDSDFVKVRVRGIFPVIGIRSLISEADVDPAYGRILRPDQYEFAPVIITCDPAWMGDDLIVIGKRQGLWYEILYEAPKNDNDIFIANKIARYEDEFRADGVAIDLGYGTGIVSSGRTMGRQWDLVAFGETPDDPGCLNKRAEMALATRNWLRAGGCIPAHPRLRDDLLQVEVVPRADGKLQLESGESMKSRGLPSPDHFSALMLSFARPYQKKSDESRPGQPGFAAHEYRPHDRQKRR